MATKSPTLQKGPLGSRKRLSGPRNKSQEKSDGGSGTRSNPRLTNSSTNGDASRILEQRRNMTPEQRESEMNKVVNKVSGRDRSRVIPPSESWPQGGNINAEGTFIPNDLPKEMPEPTPTIEDSGYQTPNYQSYGADDFTADTSPSEPMAYKTSMATYKLPGEGSRENYSEGTFREDNRAVQAGLIVEGGFGDLTGSYKGSSGINQGMPMGGAQLTQVGGGGGGGEDAHQMLNQKSSDYDAGPESEFEGMAVPKLQ